MTCFDDARHKLCAAATRWIEGDSSSGGQPPG